MAVNDDRCSSDPFFDQGTPLVSHPQRLAVGLPFAGMPCLPLWPQAAGLPESVPRQSLDSVR